MVKLNFQVKKLFPINKGESPKQLKLIVHTKHLIWVCIEDELTTIQSAKLFVQQAHKDPETQIHR